MNFFIVITLFSFTSSVQASTAQAIYKLDTSYSGDSLFNEFDFYTGADPTHGFVNYLDQRTASKLGLVSVNNGVAHMGVDSTTTLDPSGVGRDSVRISSQKSWNHGLFIADIKHMPGSQCGIWPAFWTLGPDWPNNGEVDIIEGVNSQQKNLMSSHTADNCTIAGSYELGTLQTNNCYAYAAGNSGCGVSASIQDTFGTGFNSIGGGVYAMEWTSSYIRIWFFSRGSIPADIASGKPNPKNWGLPQANFQGSCDIDSHFLNMQLVFDTTFCGDWASNVWSKDAICSVLAPTCVDYVAGSPSAFTDAYWAVNSINVYTRQVNVIVNGPAASTVTQQVLANLNPTSPPLHAPDTPQQVSDIPPQSAYILGPQVSQIPVAEAPDGQITSGGPSNTSAQSNPADNDTVPNPLNNNAPLSPEQFMQQIPDYLPPVTTTAIPAEQTFGQARGGCACSENHTRSTAQKIVNSVLESCSINPLSYGSMTATTSTTHATQVMQVSEVHTVMATAGAEPSTTCEEVPSMTSDSYAQVSNGAGVPVDVRLGAVGAVLGLIGLAGMAL